MDGNVLWGAAGRRTGRYAARLVYTCCILAAGRSLRELVHPCFRAFCCTARRTWLRPLYGDEGTVRRRLFQRWHPHDPRLGRTERDHDRRVCDRPRSALGRESLRERGCRYVYTWWGAV